MIKKCKTRGCQELVEEMSRCFDCSFDTEKKRKELLAQGKDPNFVEILLKGAVKPKRFF